LPTLMLQCSRCAAIFSSGMAVSNGGTIILESCYAECPRCGSTESIPDGIIQETVEGIARLLQKSSNPLQEVGDILGALENSRQQGSVSPLQSRPWYLKFKKWLPDTPEKIAAYVTIFAAMHQILTKNPGQHIEYSPTFIEQYNQTIIYQQPALKPPSKTRKIEPKVDKGFAQYGRK
jgi:hypothetical protein